jgi:hypothetical protein
MATVKELVTRFGFEIDDAGLKKIEEGISAMKDGLLGLGGVMAGTAATLYGFLTSAAHAGEALKLQSEQTGIAVEALQKLQFTAQLANVSGEELTMSMGLLSKHLIDAKNGSHELQGAFRKVGISGDVLRSGTLKTDQAFAMISARLAKMPDGPERTALALQFFGRSGARMINVAKQMDEGLTPLQQKVLALSTITAEQANAADNFGDSLTVLQSAVRAVANIIGFDLMPAAKEVVDQMARWIVENKDLIRQNLTGFVKALTSALKLTIWFADILIKSLEGLAHGFGGAETATKGFLFVLTLLSSASILIGIGKLMESVVKLGNSFKMASLSAAAIPLLVGLAMVALLLIMEDIYSFFTGKDSFLGDLLELLPELGEAFKAIFEPIFEPFVAFTTKLTDGFTSWIDLFNDLGELILNVILAPLRAVFAIVGSVASLIGRLTGSSGISGLGAGISAFASDITGKGLIDGATSLLGVGPQEAIESTKGSGPRVANDLQVTNQFNFPPGTDPTKVEGPISTAVGGGIDDVLRQTQNATSNGGAY